MLIFLACLCTYILSIVQESVEALLNAGADVTQRNNDGLTPAALAGVKIFLPNESIPLSCIRFFFLGGGGWGWALFSLSCLSNRDIQVFFSHIPTNFLVFSC